MGGLRSPNFLNHVQNKTKQNKTWGSRLSPRHVTAMQLGGTAPLPTLPLFSAGQARVEAYESSLKQNMGFSTWSRAHVAAMNSLLLETRIMNTKIKRRSERGGIAPL